MKIEIANLLDVSDRVLDIGREDATFSRELFTQSSRQIKLADNDGFLSPINGGHLDPANLGWKNQRVTIDNDSGERVFSGLMLDARTIVEEDQIVTQIEAIATMGALMDFGVEVNRKLTLAAAGAHGAGAQEMRVSDSTAWSGIAVMSPNATLNPSFLVVDKDENGNIKLDRPIESDIVDGQSLQLSVPRIDAPTAILADVLRDVLDIVDREDDLDEASVTTQILREQARGDKAYVFVTAADQISLRDFIRQAVEAFCLYVRESPNGAISIVEGAAYQGGHPRVRLSDSNVVEINEAYPSAGNGNPHYWAYECAYLPEDAGQDVSATLQTASRRLPIDKLYPYYPTQPFVPFPISSLGSLGGNGMLYFGRATAERYGEKNLNYYRVNRKRLRLTVFAENNGREFALRQFDTVLLDDLTLDDGRTITKTPAFVTSLYFDDERGLYTDVEVELSNEVFPALTAPSI